MKKLVLSQILVLIFILGGFFGLFTALNGWEINIPQIRCLVVFLTGLLTALFGSLFLYLAFNILSRVNKVLCLDMFAAVVAIALTAIFALFPLNVYNLYIIVVGGLSVGLVSGGTAVLSSKKFIEGGYKKRVFLPPFIGGTVIFLAVTITLF